jgi:hypothetical protein
MKTFKETAWKKIKIFSVKTDGTYIYQGALKD